MTKILIVEPVHAASMPILEARSDISFETISDTSEANLLTKIIDADALTIRVSHLSEKVLQAATKLKVVSRHGVGYDNIPVETCTRLGIPLTIVGAVNSVAVAEHTFYLILALAKFGVHYNQAIKHGGIEAWDKLQALELNGKNLLIIGYGRVGKEVAIRARAFGLNVIVYDPFYCQQPDDDITLVQNLNDGLCQANIMTLHLPLLPETRNLIREEQLNLLPDNAIVVNTSRGGIINESSLVNVLSSGHLLGVGLDVFEEEPVRSDHPLLQFDRVIVTPHSASLTEDTLIAMGNATLQNALDGVDGKLDPNLVVNPEVLRM
ncbi:MAG: hydroxyacid dehydrogenase [Rhodobacteraceae bacterium]|nr:hydroxyacid dehydrogenase [Paracoccaceae bacterium]